MPSDLQIAQSIPLSQIKFFQQKLIHWSETQGRKNLPWQEDKTLYKVWISEIMLQQTQVSTVIPYYLKFINSFPTLLDLANAPIEKILAHWSGLGYYARARNLHKAAIQIKNIHHGQFPKTLSDVLQLPGIGQSTAAAILSIADHQPLAICDGNVKRVFSRLHAITTPLNQNNTEKTLLNLSTQYMLKNPSPLCATYSQAIMDLGATLCTKAKPKCNICPVQSLCQAYLTGQPENYPKPKKALIKTQKSQTFLIFRTAHHIALKQRPLNGIWGGLFTPICTESSEIKNHFLFKKYFSDTTLYIKNQKHCFTHFDLYYDAYIFSLPKITPIEDLTWHDFSQLNNLGLPRPIQKLLYKTHT